MRTMMRFLTITLAASLWLACASGFAAGAKQTAFSSAEEGMQALASAMKAHDVKALSRILGPEGKSLLESGDPVEDKDTRERFTQAYDKSHKLEERGRAKTFIVVGDDNWPMPIPLVKRGSAWYFDTRAGKDEIINRRIGRNELSTKQVMLAFVDAQQDYYSLNPQKEKLLQYAQKFVSSPGKRDGLYYPTASGEKPSPLGPAFNARRAKAGAEDMSKPRPYHGYYYKILKGQGSGAPGGAYNYVVNGRMLGGFALVAYPATYGSSGIMTFIVNHDGVVYEKDLGPNTAEIAQQMTRFNPDSSWKRD